MKHLAFALLTAALLPAVAQAQQAVDEELPPGMAPDEPDRDYLFDEQEDEGPVQPHRIFASAGGGVSLRIVQDLDFAQDRFAPAYVDLFGAFVFGTSQTWRHGAGLGFSLNATGDGSASRDIGPEGFQQVVLTPSYLAYFRFGWDLAITAKVGVSLVVSPEVTLGGEIAGGGVYYLLAGFGLYAEVGASTWLGADNTVHPVISAEGGVVFDYEVLP